MVNIYPGIVLSHKKDEILTFGTTRMVLENTLSKIRQELKNHMISLTWHVKLRAINEQQEKQIKPLHR